ncbi:hypothetical protein CHRYSEOSP005_30450 [Chryseobacterium sp. Alg-005]
MIDDKFYTMYRVKCTHDFQVKVLDSIITDYLLPIIHKKDRPLQAALHSLILEMINF